MEGRGKERGRREDEKTEKGRTTTIYNEEYITILIYIYDSAVFVFPSDGLTQRESEQNEH